MEAAVRKWLRRIRGAIGMGLVWAVGGAGIGMFIELLANVLPGGFPLASRVDIWPVVLAIAGFLCGGVFSVVLGIAARRRSIGELSVPKFAAWGAFAGLLLGGFLVLAVGADVAFIAITTAGSAIGAAGSLALARMGVERPLLDRGGNLDRLGSSEHEERIR